MLISVLIGTVLLSAAQAAPFDADRVSIGVPAEVDLVGLAFGVRPELLWQPFHADGAAQLRVATGLMVGPELVFVPVSLTMRGRLRPKAVVHPILGTGAELQTFYSSGHPAVARLAWLGELGLDVDVGDRWSIGLVLEPGFAPPPLFGFGAAVRVGAVYAL